MFHVKLVDLNNVSTVSMDCVLFKSLPFHKLQMTWPYFSTVKNNCSSFQMFDFFFMCHSMSF